jgi:hypothetical protein
VARGFESMIPLHPAFMWYRAASAGYAKPRDWQAWADERIAVSQQIPDWLINLSLADDIERMLLATEPERARECGIPGWADDEAVFGYLALRLRAGEIELDECLDQCVKLACQYDREDDCNEFCFQLSQLVADHPKHVAAAEDFLRPYVRRAEMEWALLKQWMPDQREENSR